MNRRDLLMTGLAAGGLPPLFTARASAAAQGSAPAKVKDVQILVFDTFGTVVDWRSGVIAEGEKLGKRQGSEDRLGRVCRCVARRLRAVDEPRTNRRASMDEARRPAPHDARRPADEVQDRQPHRRREEGFQQGVASVARLARFGGRADATQEAVHPVAAFERQHGASDRDGEVCGPALGLHPRRPTWRGTTSPTKRCITCRPSSSASRLRR